MTPREKYDRSEEAKGVRRLVFTVPYSDPHLAAPIVKKGNQSLCGKREKIQRKPHKKSQVQGIQSK